MSDPLIYSRNFRYVNAAESSKPNYLKDKFDRIWREQRKRAEAETAKPVATVRAIKAAK